MLQASYNSAAELQCGIAELIDRERIGKRDLEQRGAAGKLVHCARGALRQRRRPTVRRPPLLPRALLDEGGDRRLEIRVEIGLRHGAPRNDIHALKRKERVGGDERAGKARACRRHRDSNLRKYCAGRRADRERCGRRRHCDRGCDDPLGRPDGAAIDLGTVKPYVIVRTTFSERVEIAVCYLQARDKAAIAVGAIERIG